MTSQGLDEWWKMAQIVRNSLSHSSLVTVGRALRIIISFIATAESDGASYFRIKDKPLGGFGNCPAVPQSVEVLNSINDPETAANFYLTALQGQCSKKQYKRILRLFGLGHLTINGDQTLSIPVACPLLYVTFRVNSSILITP